MNRRSFLLGLAAGLAPAIIRTPGLLMPVRALAVPNGRWSPAAWSREQFERGLIVSQEEMEESLGFGLAQLKTEGDRIAYDGGMDLSEAALEGALLQIGIYRQLARQRLDTGW